jgi:SSS family solute:Na+ symporter
MKTDAERAKILTPLENNSSQLTVKEEHKLVSIGKWFSLISLIIGVIIAPTLKDLDQAFQYIQEYTGFISPGVLAIFILGLFWKRTSTNAAMIGVIIAIPISMAFKFLTPGIPFLDRMGLSFLLISAIMVVISMLENKNDDPKAIYFDSSLFKTSIKFNIMSLVVIAAVAAIYLKFW